MKNKILLFLFLILFIWLLSITSMIVEINLWPFGLSFKIPVIILIVVSLCIGFLIGYLVKTIRK